MIFDFSEWTQYCFIFEKVLKKKFALLKNVVSLWCRFERVVRGKNSGSIPEAFTGIAGFSIIPDQVFKGLYDNNPLLFPQ